MKFETENESEILKDICMQNGLSEKQASTMLSRLNDDFYPLSENETLGLLDKIGFHKTQRFIQVASYKGFIVFK